MKQIVVIFVTALVCLSTGAIGATHPGSSVDITQESTATEVSSCRDITEPGRYVLTRDIVDFELNESLQSEDDRCIEIKAGDVVFDGNGHILDAVAGGDGVPIGIDIAPGARTEAENVTVRDVTVTDWDEGISVAGARDIHIQNVTATNNGLGLSFSGTNDVVITGNNISKNRLLAERKGIYITEGSGYIIQNNVVRHNNVGLDIGLASNVTFSDNILADNSPVPRSRRTGPPDPGRYSPSFNLRATQSMNVAVKDNEIRNGTVIVNDAQDGRDNVLRNNTLDDAPVQLTDTTQITVAGNRIVNTGRNPDLPRTVLQQGAVTIVGAAANTTVKNNTITDPQKGATGIDAGIVVSGEANATVIQNNHVSDASYGVWIDAGANGVTVRSNVIRNNTDGILVAPSEQEETTDVEIHRNVIAGNRDFGVHNSVDGVVNATNNFWGTSDGPSSPRERFGPCKDPVTGTPADGSGDTISENPTQPGISNVHFDPWLDTTPLNVGVVEE